MSTTIKITLKRPTIFTLPGGFVLAPGPDQNNRVPVEVWDKCKDHPVVRAWIREGAIVVDGQTSEVPGPPNAEDFGQRSASEAIAMINGCDEPAQIHAWVVGESRKTVRRAASRRIADLAAQGESREAMVDRAAEAAENATSAQAGRIPEVIDLDEDGNPTE